MGWDPGTGLAPAEPQDALQPHKRCSWEQLRCECWSLQGVLGFAFHTIPSPRLSPQVTEMPSTLAFSLFTGEDLKLKLLPPVQRPCYYTNLTSDRQLSQEPSRSAGPRE